MKITATLVAFLFLLPCATAQTKISLKQLPNCTAAGSTTPIILALAPGSTTQFACYALQGVTLIPATPGTPPAIVIPSTVLPTFVFGETPSGAIDGTNTVYTLAGTPVANTVQVHVNGLLLAAGVDYNITGNIITFVASATPQPGDVVRVGYLK